MSLRIERHDYNDSNAVLRSNMRNRIFNILSQIVTLENNAAFVVSTIRRYLAFLTRKNDIYPANQLFLRQLDVDATLTSL